jgi:hypothetical protein
MLKLEQLSKTYHSEYDVECSQSMIARCGKRSLKYIEVNFFSSSKNKSKGVTFDEKSKSKLLSMFGNIARLCWKSTRRDFS